MCYYFSCILRPGGVVLWCEDDSHETIIHRARMQDKTMRRNFLRVECRKGSIGNFRVDEPNEDDLPTWFSEHRNEYIDNIKAILVKVRPLHAPYARSFTDEAERTYVRAIKRARIQGFLKPDWLLDEEAVSAAKRRLAVTQGVTHGKAARKG